MDQEEIAVLAHNVYHFKEALKKLTNTFLEQDKGEQYIQSAVHERLSEVLRILKSLLEKYPDLQSTELLLKTQNLILHVQGYSPGGSEDNKDLYDFINQLATAFSVRVSEYLMGDTDMNLPEPCQDSSVPKCEAISKKINGNKVDTAAVTMTTFGVDLDQHLLMTGTTVPIIVRKCIQEIDERGILVKGIYRVSGVKSRVEKLCQEFEQGGENVDLSDIHPNVIANVLKLYLRQLPQPLFTFKLYPEFLRFAKNWPCNSLAQPTSNVTEELKEIIYKLPKNYLLTVTMLMQHLKRVSSQDDINNMSPSNLGIVFGPTLLRTNDERSCMFSLLDTVHQTRVIELIITWADEIFPPSHP